jgi:general secretion pathway protein K
MSERSVAAKGRGGERGIALLITLLVVTLVSVIVVEFTQSTDIDAHLTRNALNALQARYLARSGIALAEITLKLDAAEKSKNPPERVKAETLSDPWAQPFPPMPVGDGFGTAGFTIIDESSKFNLNSLAVTNPNPAELEMRKQLYQGILGALEIDQNLLFPLLDWLDPGDDTDRESGAESAYYLALTPPYEPRNGKLLSVEELLLIRGYDQLTREQWLMLRSIVTALPNDELKINVNTAPEILLTGIFSALGSESLGRSVANQRAERAFVGQDLQELLKDQIPPLARPKFDVRSQTFTIYATGTSGTVERTIAVTEQLPPNVFPPKLTLVSWRDDSLPVSLTSGGASGGMKSVASP